MNIAYPKPNLLTQRSMALVGLCVFILSNGVWANYTVKITNPSEDRAYIRPAESVDIALMVEPKLNALETLVVSIDGHFLTANQTNTILNSGDYAPGEHIIKAEIQDETGQVIASDVRTIYLIQNTQLMRDNRAKAEAKATYEAAPWYKKLLLKLSQENKPKPNQDNLLFGLGVAE